MKSSLFYYLIICLAIGSIASDCGKEPLDPNPSIKVTVVSIPETGSIITNFKFIAQVDYQYLNNPVFNYRWDFDYDGIGDFSWDTPFSEEISINHVFNSAKKYTVVVEAKVSSTTDKAYGYKEVVVSNLTPPVADFEGDPTSGTTPVGVYFTDQSTNEPTSWQWDFGNGESSTEQNPIYTYNDAGTYTVKLTATNDHGSDIEEKVDYIIVTNGGFGIPCPGAPIVIYEDEEYNTVQILDQCWLKENLNVGERLDYYVVNSTNNGQIEKYCYHDLESKCDEYGGMYQWDEMMNYVNTEGAQGICPPGWHIPDFEEIGDLRENLYFIGTYIDPNLGQTNTGKQIQHPDNNCEGLCQDLGQSGFDFLLGGITPDLLVNTEGEEAQFWTSSETNTINARSLRVLFDFHLWHTAGPGTSKTLPAYVRCIKNE